MNTCERAWRMLQDRHRVSRLKFRIETRRKIAPAGQFSDGTRAIILEPCNRFRWISAIDGAGFIIAEVDQRDFWENPQGMIDALEAKLGGLNHANRT
jgi:hypothetical protein